MLWYSLDFPRRGDSNEYPQHIFLWRNKQNYPLIITKYPSHVSVVVFLVPYTLPYIHLGLV